MNELDLFYCFHKEVGNYPICEAIERWRTLPADVMEKIEKRVKEAGYDLPTRG